MSAPERIARALTAHPWLASVRANDAGALLWLSPAGLTELHRRGRQSLLDALQARLAAQQLASPRDWRLLDAARNTADGKMITGLLDTPRPRMPALLTEQQLDGNWKLKLCLPLDLVHFDDHFRRAPVLPGVVQAHWALALAAPRLDTSKHCRAMEALKFQRLLRPGDQVELSLRYERVANADRGKLHFAYHLDGAHCSSGRLRVVQNHG